MRNGWAWMLLLAVALAATGRAVAVEAPPPVAPSSAAPSPPATFEALLATAWVIEPEELLRSVLGATEDAPEPGALVAIETDRVTVVPGATPETLRIRIDAALYVPAYSTRMSAVDPRSPIGPLLTATAGAPAKIDPPDFTASMTYVLPAAAPAAETKLSFPDATAAGAFRVAHATGLRAQVVVRPGAAWKGSVLDPYVRTTIGEDGAARTEKKAGPRRDEVVGLSCAVLGYRIYVAAGPEAGKVIASAPASASTRTGSIASAPLGGHGDGDGDGAGAPAPAVEPAFLASAPPTAAAAADASDCRAARDGGDLRTALVSCTRAVERDPLDGEAAAILRAIPRAPSAEALRLEGARIAPAVRRCGPAGSEPVKVELFVSPAGAVVAAAPAPPYTGTPIGKCVADAARAMKLPPFAATAAVKVSHVFAVW